MDKEQLRISLRESLLEMTPEQRSKKSKEACRNLISTPQFRDTSVVMMYLSLPHEVDTSEAILLAWQLGKIVAVPKVSWQQRHMIPVQINSLETDFSTEASGLRNPVTGVPLPFEEMIWSLRPVWALTERAIALAGGHPITTDFLQAASSRPKSAVSPSKSRSLIWCRSMSMIYRWIFWLQISK